MKQKRQEANTTKAAVALPSASFAGNDSKEIRKLKNRESALASRRKRTETIERLTEEIARLKNRLSRYEDVSDCEEENTAPMESTSSHIDGNRYQRHTQCLISQPAVLF
jgi:hypothetical protein